MAIDVDSSVLWLGVGRGVRVVSSGGFVRFVCFVSFVFFGFQKEKPRILRLERSRRATDRGAGK